MTQPPNDLDDRSRPLPVPGRSAPPLLCGSPPRPLTDVAARRAWTEPTVRRWWLMAAAVLAMIGTFAANRLWVREGENRLIRGGVPAMALVLSNDIHSQPGQTADVGREVVVRFPFNGQPVTLHGFLTRSALIGARVPIHVDPADPGVWTDQTEATPVLHAIFVGLLLLPLAAALTGVAWLARRTAVRTFRFGRPALAVVSARGQTPIAPLSFAVRCSLRDGPDRTIRTVYVPPAGRPLAKGDELWLLVPARGRPVAAMWFE